jgi:Protein of unknown function (DUF2637)
VIRFTTAAVVCAVAAFAAVVSYSHIYGLGRAHGQDGTAARMLPLSVDGLIMAASLVLLHEAATTGTRQGWPGSCCGSASPLPSARPGPLPRDQQGPRPRTRTLSYCGATLAGPTVTSARAADLNPFSGSTTCESPLSHDVGRKEDDQREARM